TRCGLWAQAVARHRHREAAIERSAPQPSARDTDASASLSCPILIGRTWGSDAEGVMQLDDAVSEPAFAEQFESRANIVGECPLAAPDEHRTKQQVAFVDQARGDRGPGQLRTADGEVAL